MSQQEVRRYPRVPVRRRAIVEFPVLNIEDDTPVEVDGALQNVSRGGLALAADMPPEKRALLGGRQGIRPGLALTVTFRASNRVFKLPGEIAWAKMEDGRALLGVQLQLERTSKATRRAFESWTLKEERAHGIEVENPARDALVERLCLLVDTLEGTIDRISKGDVDDHEAVRVNELAEALQAACTMLELGRLRRRLT